MIYDSGVLTVCALKNTAEAGEMPVEKLIPIKKFWYGERTVGFNRFYAAQGANQQIDLLVRIPSCRRIRAGMYAVLGNGSQYRIDYIAQGGDEDELRWTDLTLSKLERNYDLEIKGEDNG